MAPVNERVVRRSNALLGYPWGREFRCTEVVPTGDGLTGAATAGLVAVGLGAFTAAMSVGPVRSALRRYVFPDPGEGRRERRPRPGTSRFACSGGARPRTGRSPSSRVRRRSGPGLQGDRADARRGGGVSGDRRRRLAARRRRADAGVGDRSAARGATPRRRLHRVGRRGVRYPTLRRSLSEKQTRSANPNPKEAFEGSRRFTCSRGRAGAHQVFLVLGAARALGRVFEVLEPRGLLGRFLRTDFAAERAEPGEVLRRYRHVLLRDALGRSSSACGTYPSSGNASTVSGTT